MAGVQTAILYVQVGYVSPSPNPSTTPEEKIEMTDRSLYQVLREKFNLGPPAGGERTVEAVPTPSREAALLNVPRGSPALLIKTTTRIRSGETFEYSVGVYRGDKTTLDIRLV
jgi:DNA-binding GntR family transcriptional regulator